MMLRKIFPMLVILVLPVLAEHPLPLLAQTAPMPAAMPTAATSGLAVGVPKLPPIATPRNQQVIPVPEQPAPDLNTPSSQTAPFEHGASVLSLPGTFARQISPTERVAPESIISQSYLGTRDDTVRGLSLKEAIYIGLANNPNVKVAELDPLASEEAVEVANGAFDPALTAEGDIIKSVVPVTSPFQVSGSRAFTNKLYDWDFGLNKVSALTNGTIGLTFNNERAYSNSSFASINPSYVPQLALSVSQPLLRNFGWNFATLNVRIAESSQKQSQWNMEQSIEDFVLRIGTDYWNVVQSEENLQVAEYALRLNSDLVRQNRIALQVGTLAPIDLQEAQSAEATSAANVYTAQAAQRAARAALRQDVMMNPASTFVPQEIEPTDKPNPTREMIPNEEVALETAIQYRPSLEGMREAIRGALMQVKFSENQTLPQLNLGAQFGLNSTAGASHCIRNFSGLISGNCAATPLVPGSGTKLPFGGIYGDALNRLFGTSFYNYAAVLNFAYPIDNAAARSVLAQTRVQYESLRMQYRASISTAVVAVQTALANLEADHKRVQATRQATYYAAQSLHDEEIRFKVGMATTHDLLQFQEQLISAQGNQVQAEVDLEDARLSLEHEQGTLLRAFQIDFQLQDPHRSPWYSKF
ncbi:MAG: TolC family protein [Candidatus Binataceae bacterium]